MLILVDQDGVLSDFDAGFASRFAAKYPDAPAFDVTTRTEFKIDGHYPVSWRDNIRGISASRGFFADLPPVPGAIDGMRALQEAGHEVFICTAPLTSYQHCVGEKFAWVEEHLGSDWVKKIVLTKDKTVVRGDVLVDDKPHVTGAMTPVWEHIRFTRSYNAHLADTLRMTWDDAPDVLDQVARRHRAVAS